MIVTNGKIYDKCDYCQKLVKINKAFFGSMHVCVSPQERAKINEMEMMSNKQLNYRTSLETGLGSPIGGYDGLYEAFKQNGKL